jgi:PAS domain S-box-containing protein
VSDSRKEEGRSVAARGEKLRRKAGVAKRAPSAVSAPRRREPDAAELRERLRRTERSLRKSEERYALATSVAVEGIYEWDIESNKLFLTGRAKEFFSIAADDLTPAAWNARIHADDYAGYVAAIIAHFKGRTRHLECEYRIVDDRGGYKWVLDRGVGVRNAGRVTKLVGALSDITIRKHAEFELRRAYDRAERALEQQTAMAEILSAMSRSPSDAQPVFELVAQRAGKLCRAEVAVVSRFAGEQIELAAIDGLVPEAVEIVRGLYPMQIEADAVTARVIRACGIVHVPDVLDDPSYALKDFARAARYRAGLGVPIIRDHRVMGCIFVGRSDPGPFADSEIDLLKAFADQAAIAIENVRLFTELEARNRDLTEALEQQTATSEILRAISRSPTDVQPVFDTIAVAALKLCSATSTVVTTFDGDLIKVGGLANVTPEGANAVRSRYPRRPGRNNAASRAVLTRRLVAIPDVLEDPEYEVSASMIAAGFRSIAAVPLMRMGEPLGAIAVVRPEPGPFPDKQLALLQIFADQAVIAIENVRLFNELEARNRALAEALERQTATSEILRVISQSPRDVQPVFDTIAAAALKLCNASSANVFTYDGTLVHLAALVNLTPAGADVIRSLWPRRPSRDLAAARAILTRDVVAIPDVVEDADFAATTAAVEGNFRSILSVPLMRDGNPIGAIAVGRPEAGPFPESQIALLQTFADQAVIAIENVRLFTELEVRNRDLGEALEQQTATAEILGVISSSHTDAQPVFDTIVRNAARLCGGMFANVLRFDGELLHFVASSHSGPEFLERMRTRYPMRPDGKQIAGRVVLGGATVVMEDALADVDYDRAMAITGQWRRMLGVPMMREGRPLGVIVVGWADPGPVAKVHQDLLKTFAEQAVIAIENVRLFTELQARNRELTDALERQTSTSEILKVISRSPTDVQPVFDTIAAAAMKLCRASSANVFTFDGALIHLVALANFDAAAAAAMHDAFPRPPGRDTAVTRAISTRGVVAIPDVLDDREYVIGVAAIAGGFRSTVSVPLIRDGDPIGAISVGRPEPGHFPDAQIALLQTFADQAVIAIENVRLFTELEVRNRDLTEALEQQTATSEILRVISRTQTDVRPVFETIVRSVLSLCSAAYSGVYLVDGSIVRLVATAGLTAEQRAVFERGFPRKLGADTVAGRAALECRLVQTADIAEDPDYAGAPGIAVGAHTVLAVPLIRDSKAIGAIGVWRSEVKTFSDTQIALLRTFADQAVIAIENVRLFTELEARTRELTRSVSELEALGEVGQAVSSTLDLETVLRTIVSRATHLAGMSGGSIWEYDEARGEFHLHATDRLPDELVEALRASPIRKGEGPLGRMAVTREPVEIQHIADEGTYPTRLRNTLTRSGYRSVLAVPLLREDHLLGALAVNRKTPGDFAPEVIELLKTFATQSALAIQNARLYREIEVKNREVEVASRHKSEFLANMSHELRTPLNAIIGFSEVLAEKMFGELNDKQAEYVGDILDSGRHLLHLINDILDLSKIEAGRMELDVSEFDLPGAIESTLTLVRERASRRAIAMVHEVDARLGTVHADEHKVKQVLLNLLSNALKFTPEGGRIEVRAGLCDSMAQIAVADTGVGIALEDQAAVFEEFRQVGTAAKKIEGTGLGLAISRKFVEMHGGRIWVDSRPGAGAVFTFTLPVQSSGVNA